MRKTPLAITLAFTLALPGFATADWKESLKQQAGKQASQKMETELGLAQPAPTGAEVYFLEPRDGATVSNPVKVVFGLRNMGVAPAGVNQENTGHHHLLIDNPTVNLGQPLPASEQVVHFGGGQTETTVKLAPGKHTLQLVLGDWKHQPHQPPVTSKTITIVVK
ncbi:DUF4399 domain-containing protein [Flagellatimonas centrodinii]|uniref:DUF4399 domain-containing protein n=1 Tax=Flagellatimonas centrodinii TaxID=2806210 RepID=UPI001FEEC78F|nr:DUF4399 domain-containing protein [Flagellatimonas centrodinii]ULQ45429.1 DUF4399 domain-containing protein [Flagellatimonas centrodinii]